ncbi:MAG: cytochrome c biogenesis protein CcdA [Bacteroidia bacterium]
MKRILVLLLLFSSWQLPAQMLNTISWSFSQKQINDSISEVYFTATLEEAWHLYSQNTPDGGPLPTEFDFEKAQGFKLEGKVKEPKAKVVFEEVFGVDVHFFEANKVKFTQRVKVLSDKPVKVIGVINGMTCKDEVGCIPMDEVAFSFSLKGRPVAAKVETSEQNVVPQIIEQVLVDTTEVDVTEVVEVPASSEEILVAAEGDCKDLIISGLEADSKDEASSEGYWFIFLLGFGGGLVALLTPCVFPMIPLTVSFFTKSAQNKRKGMFMAILYGLSIAGIYTLLAVPFIVFKVPPDTLNEIATSSALNIVFFVVFVVFAISFFGYFEIQLPSSLANKADSASNMGGILGVFFMAITLALVSFSCTGPILGSFLAGTLATNPDPYNILSVMLGFGTALGLPFALFAMFPSWLNSLPKSGGWLNSVKVVLGFLELGMALKFLSNADLVEQWGILKRETFLVIWALIAFGLTLYLLGFIRFPHDSPLKKRGAFRLGLSGFFLIAGVYFTTGIFGSNLELISGFPPPMFYSYAAASAKKDLASAEGDNHCPQGIPCEHDFYEAMERAKAENKPLLIDFTGWACVNCRRMEEGVWVDNEVKKLMSEEYVLVSLYVDEKKELPEDEQFTSCVTGKNIKTVGNKWSNMQVVNFKTNSQPQYILLSPEGKLLAEPVGYTSTENYLSFLKSGLSASGKTASK